MPKWADRVGVSLPVDLPFALAEQVALARAADEVGYRVVLAGETGAFDVFALLSWVAATTRRIDLGTGVVSVYSRPVAVLATGYAALAAVDPRREVIAGIGAGSVAIVRDWFGVEFTNPSVRVEETLLALRSLLAGERLKLDGRTIRSRGFKLPAPPASVRLHVGAMGPRMLSVAGELADGVILGLCTPTTARSAVARVTRAAKDRPRPQLQLSGFRVYCGPRVREARAHAKRTLLGYAMVPSHRGRFVEAGLEFDAAHEAWQSGQRVRALAYFPDEAVDLFCAIGRPDEVATRVEQYLEAGVDRVLVHPIGAGSDDHPGALDTVYEVGRTLFSNG